MKTYFVVIDRYNASSAEICTIYKEIEDALLEAKLDMDILDIASGAESVLISELVVPDDFDRDREDWYAKRRKDFVTLWKDGLWTDRVVKKEVKFKLREVPFGNVKDRDEYLKRIMRTVAYPSSINAFGGVRIDPDGFNFDDYKDAVLEYLNLDAEDKKNYNFVEALQVRGIHPICDEYYPWKNAFETFYNEGNTDAAYRAMDLVFMDELNYKFFDERWGCEELELIYPVGLSESVMNKIADLYSGDVREFFDIENGGKSLFVSKSLSEEEIKQELAEQLKVSPEELSVELIVDGNRHDEIPQKFYDWNNSRKWSTYHYNYKTI